MAVVVVLGLSTYVVPESALNGFSDSEQLIVVVVALVVALGTPLFLSLRTRLILDQGSVVIFNPLRRSVVSAEEGLTAEWRDSFAYGYGRFRGARLCLIRPSGDRVSLTATVGERFSSPRMQILRDHLATMNVEVPAAGAFIGG
jgi:hypothetical protein